MKKLFLVIGMFSLFFLIACTKQTNPQTYDCTGTSPTYTTDIKPIFDANCAASGCHSNSSRSSGFDLSAYAGSKAASSSDKLLGSIQHLSGYTSMPQNAAKLSDAQIKLISCWVQNGAPQ